MRTLRLLFLATLLALAAPAANAGIVLYSSSFDGLLADDLNGVAVNTSGATAAQHALYGTSSTATWSANTKFKADGTFAGDGTTLGNNNLSATLVFTPQNGHVYQLDMTTNFTSASAGWFATGFFMQEEYTGSTFAANGGTVWALTRPGNAPDQVAHFNVSGGTGVVNDSSPTFDTTAPSTLRILLNTTAGTNNWSATYFVSDNSGGFNRLGSVANLGAVTIRSVGIGVLTTETDRQFQSFELSVIPEPSSALLLGVGALLLLGRRRR